MCLIFYSSSFCPKKYPHATNAGERLVGMLMEIFEGLPVVELPEIWQVEIVHRQSTGPIL